MRKYLNEAGLWLIGLPVFLWTVIPIWHLTVLSFSPKDDVTAGTWLPSQFTVQNFEIIAGQKHYYLNHFWQQFGNSLFIAVAAGLLTLGIATFAAFSISRLKTRGGNMVMNFALATYLIPAAFLAVPMYKVMGQYGLLNSQWSLILAMVTLASPYAIWVLKHGRVTSCLTSWMKPPSWTVPRHCKSCGLCICR